MIMTEFSDDRRDPVAMARKLGVTADATRVVADCELGETRQIYLALASSLDSLAESILAAARELKRTSH
jgi:hypothetical protein